MLLVDDDALVLDLLGRQWPRGDLGFQHLVDDLDGHRVGTPRRMVIAVGDQADVDQAVATLEGQGWDRRSPRWGAWPGDFGLEGRPAQFAQHAHVVGQAGQLGAGSSGRTTWAWTTVPVFLGTTWEAGSGRRLTPTIRIWSLASGGRAGWAWARGKPGRARQHQRGQQPPKPFFHPSLMRFHLPLSVSPVTNLETDR